MKTEGREEATGLGKPSTTETSAPDNGRRFRLSKSDVFQSAGLLAFTAGVFLLAGPAPALVVAGLVLIAYGFFA